MHQQINLAQIKRKPPKGAYQSFAQPKSSQGSRFHNPNGIQVNQAHEVLSMSYDHTSPHNMNNIYKRENS